MLSCTKFTKALIKSSNLLCVELSIKCPCASNLPFMPEISKIVSAVNFDMAVFIINCNSSCAFCPLAEAVINPHGLFVKIVVEIHHSIAFFSPLGILKIYSGVQIIIPSEF